MKATTNKDIRVLVNNVGIHQGGPKPFDQVKYSKITESVNVNCLYPTLLTSRMVDYFLKRLKAEPRTRFLIINLSSVVGCSQAVPRMSVYGATKAFNHIFSLCLSADLLQTSIDVLCVNPGLTASNMTSVKASMFVSSAEECAEGALNKVGLVDVIPHWKHGPMWLGMAFGDWCPAIPRTWILSQFGSLIRVPIKE